MSPSLELLASAAAVAASLGALARTTRTMRVHVFGIPLLLLGWLGLLCAVAPASLRDHLPVLVGGILVAVAVAWIAAGRLAGAERWVLAAAALVLTVRIPVPVGGDTSMLLVPLYAVIGVASIVLVRSELRLVAATTSTWQRAPGRGGATRLLDIGAAALPALATLSLTWSIDEAASARMLACFLVLLYAIVRAWSARGVDLRPAACTLVGSIVAAALVGLYQAATHTVWWNPKVVDANHFRADFRTNSLFWDPNIYGRALAVAIVAVIAWMLVAPVRRWSTSAAVAVLAVLTAALWNTFSQSSWVALAASLAVIAVLTLPPRARRWACGALVVFLVVSLPFAARQLDGDDAQGRGAVVRDGIALAADRPVLGWGVNTFEEALRARERSRGDATPGLTASHTTPVTVFAELGVLGAFTYLTLLASAVLAILARWRRSSTPASQSRASGADVAATGWPVAPVIWATGAFVLLVVHSLLYAGFFEDPTTWVALALLASLPVVTTD